MILTILLIGIALVASSAFINWKLLARRTPEGMHDLEKEHVRLQQDMKQIQKQIGELEAELESEKSEKNKLAGSNRQMYAEVVGLKEDAKGLQRERDALKKRVAEFEAADTRREKESEARLGQLTKAEETLKEERQRVIRQDEETRKKREEERDRIWAEHEMSVIARLTELCKQPQYAFSSFSNTNLPDGFDGSLKPDFMIEFLDQYVIFDAKVSKAKSLQTYINDTVKSTVQKVKKNAKIYSQIFLVVPTEAAAELKSHYYPLDGYTLFVVSPESLPVILACYKRIAQYDRIEELDPQQRENIVNVIAELDFHVNVRNAADVILATMGTNMLQKVQKLQPDLAMEVAAKKQEMKLPNLNTSELKKLAGSVAAQVEAIRDLATPKATVKQQHLELASAVITQTLP
ncbi:hypothetical protein HY285_01270 [Candidatus Peregrinibacteria bacterium]|nr:hypothetical protein [Candidatus Peregrinibacteria bacterium]